MGSIQFAALEHHLVADAISSRLSELRLTLSEAGSARMLQDSLSECPQLQVLYVDSAVGPRCFHSTDTRNNQTIAPLTELILHEYSWASSPHDRKDLWDWSRLTRLGNMEHKLCMQFPVQASSKRTSIPANTEDR